MRSGFLNGDSSAESCVSSSSTKNMRHKRKFRTDHVQQSLPKSASALVAALPSGLPSSLTTNDDRSLCAHECTQDSVHSSRSWSMDHCSLSVPDVTSLSTTTVASPDCTGDGSGISRQHDSHVDGVGSGGSVADAYDVSQHHMKMHQLKGSSTFPSTMLLSHHADPSPAAHLCSRDDALESDDLQEPDWDQYSESQLEDILLNMLDVLYKESIEKIVLAGFSEMDAIDAVLRNGRWNGKDALSSVVESSLSWLKSKEDRNGELCFSDLKEMERQVLAEMVSFLRTVRPFLSKGDAMWCLLVCDMNILACAVEDDASKDLSPPKASSSELKSSLDSPNTPSKPRSLPVIPNNESPKSQEGSHPTRVGLPPSSALVKPSRSSKSAFSTPNFSSSPDGKVAVANRQSNCVMQPNGSPLQSDITNLIPESEIVSSSNERQLTAVLVSEQHLEGAQDPSHGQCSIPPAERCSAVSTAFHSESSQSSCQNSFSGQEVSPRPTSEIKPFVNKFKCTDDSDSCRKPPQDVVQTQNAHTASSPSETCSALNFANSSGSNHTSSATKETSAKLPSRLKINNCKDASISNNNIHDGSVDRLLGWTGVDGEQRKTEMLLQLVDHIKYLESQLQEWSQWAQKKVMQAAQRLRKDSAELKSLRLERDEFARLKKEKQSLEESTVKKLSEMENALRKALSQVDRANTTARRLKAENAEVRAEMEAAKLTAAEYFSVFQEISKRENKSTKKAQAWEKQKMKLQDEVAEEKRKLANLLQQLSQAQEQYQRTEAKYRQERKVKEEAIAHAELEKRAKEQLEFSYKRREEALQRKSEIESQNHYDQVRKLQSEIARVKSSSGLPLKSMPWSQQWPENCSYERLQQINARLMTEITELQDSQKDIRRDRECVMCMSEEMSVVFLPCAHQVVCIKCNDLHQKQGLTDCPSCRTPIQQRIRVYGVNA